MPEPLPQRRLTDPRELRAMAHPLRVRIVEELFLDGPLTASQLSERLGESPANCSWHLRQLAKYGYVAETGEGIGRQRPWQAVVESRSWGGRQEGEAAAAGQAMSSLMYQREFDEWRAFQERKGTEPDDWYDAAFWNQSFAWLTADELRALGNELVEVILRYTQERFTDPASRPADARPVRFVAWGFPTRPAEKES